MAKPEYFFLPKAQSNLFKFAAQIKCYFKNFSLKLSGFAKKFYFELAAPLVEWLNECKVKITFTCLAFRIIPDTLR